MRVYECAKALCGKIIRAYAPSGQKIVTANVGKRVFWNMHSTAPGVYEGRAWVPAHNREYDASMHLRGNKLTVKGCVGPVCMSQKWKRVN